MGEIDVLELDIVQENIDQYLDEKKKHGPKKVTSEFMNKYEYSRLIACRAMQLSRGMPALVEVESYDPLEIAKAELHSRVIPLAIKRILPNGDEEIWKVQDMHIRDC